MAFVGSTEHLIKGQAVNKHITLNSESGGAPILMRPQVFVMDQGLDIHSVLGTTDRHMIWDIAKIGSPMDLANRFRNGGLDLKSDMQRYQMQLPIIFTAKFGDILTTDRAMKARAVEMLLKPIAKPNLIRAIEEAIQLSSECIQKQAALQELQDRHSSFTKREQEVMALVVTGSLNKQIGFELGISEITVKAHGGSMMRKMRARSLADDAAVQCMFADCGKTLRRKNRPVRRPLIRPSENFPFYRSLLSPTFPVKQHARRIASVWRQFDGFR